MATLITKEEWYSDIRKKVISCLEEIYRLDIAQVQLFIPIFFGKGFLPTWYFHFYKPEDIASHIVIYNQLLNANMDYVQQESLDGNALTYMINIGRDRSGMLANLVEKNRSMHIASIKSEKTKSGIRIVNISRYKVIDIEHKNLEINEVLSKLNLDKSLVSIIDNNDYLKKVLYKYFLDNIESPFKHFQKRVKILFSTYYQVITRKNHFITTDEGLIHKGEKHLSIGLYVPSNKIIVKILRVLEQQKVNMVRSYYDLLAIEEPIGVMSIYVDQKVNLEKLKETIHQNIDNFFVEHKKEIELISKVKNLILTLNSCKNKTLLEQTLVELENLCNSEQEHKNFYLDALRDFFLSTKKSGLYSSKKVLELLLRFQGFYEFSVDATTESKENINLSAYRAEHNNFRGPYKGGLRIDSIVEFDEVGALSFIMTWKCARAGIMFGGAKGGLTLNPNDYLNSHFDFKMNIGNFGRELFHVTGPLKDVPAGDVGCGPFEIGHLFDGFKSALRDLAIIAYGLDERVAFIGNRILSRQQVLDKLRNDFGIDVSNPKILRHLCTDEHYLSLVASGQITGKPKMGIDARTGATGRGIFFTMAQMIVRLYLEGSWAIEDALTTNEQKLLEKTASVLPENIIEVFSENFIDENERNQLMNVIYPKLIKNKKIIVQGAGKVATGVMEYLQHCKVNLVAISNAQGAIAGNNLDIDELFAKLFNATNVDIMSCENNVEQKLTGNDKNNILTMECDILMPAALENAITLDNCDQIKAKIIVCGANGPVSSRASDKLDAKGIHIVYDYLANAGGVIASYFEWLRNLTEKYRYETEIINEKDFDIDKYMNKYIMPVFRNRIIDILSMQESAETTKKWNDIIQDIQISSLNSDYINAKKFNTSLKFAGFIFSTYRVLAAALVNKNLHEKNEKMLQSIWQSLDNKNKEELKLYFRDPELKLLNPNAKQIINNL